ncbi:small subunit ribosomal protein S9 [Actinokineospora alba]|uniref:Small ribosomal subunit protein uS9 n=1 Tax=Actinokineospora alba TaxID=504798 RepID=A0A1H0V5G5_9PSEU|nr:small subunit ribosomal protein S9 [Actinokineospora alba]SDH63404.1 small subunit ribosomal protein S9 [Actinokineospora alba]SDP73697.1 small subunit ribosomal protein S9 [Actinokineospora alba]
MTPETDEAVAAVETDEAPAAVETEAAETEAVEADAPAADEEAPVADEAPVAEDATEEAADAPAIPHLTSETAQTVGRRKQAIVRVRFTPGTGKFLLNGKSLEEYFPNKVHQQLIREPLVLVEKPESFDIRANLHGGGITGQAGALRLAIARALIELDSEDRPPLKKAGFLTRDPRAKERKKYGLKKARKAPQYSKR